MGKNKIYLDGDICRKCGAEIKTMKVYPKGSFYKSCMKCRNCNTLYFNNNLENLKKKREERMERRHNGSFEYKKDVRERYYTKPYSGINDIVERMKDVVERIQGGRMARQVLIRIFEINFRKSTVKHPHGYTNEEVLVVMREMASHDLMKKKWIKKKTNSELREEYNEKKLKDSWRPHVDGDKCYVCKRKADVRHHLVPLKNGGSNSFRNIRVLCNTCHAEIHHWLKT